MSDESKFVAGYLEHYQFLNDRKDLSEEANERRKKIMSSLLAQCKSELESTDLDDELCKWAYDFCQNVSGLSYDLASARLDSQSVSDIIGTSDFAFVTEKLCKYRQAWRELYDFQGHVLISARELKNADLEKAMEAERSQIKAEHPECFD